MDIKEQLIKIKENWLIAVLFLIVILLFSGISSLSGSMGAATSYQAGARDLASTSAGPSGAEARGGTGYYGGADFAPEIEERIITRNAVLSTEVERGTFREEESKLNSIINSPGVYLLHESVEKYGVERKSYRVGNYQIKVKSSKYEDIVSQLKEIGEVQSFSENREDITAEYTDLKTEIKVEKERLARYEEMYNQTESVSDKIELTDKIFNQERKISYMKDWLETKDQQVKYSTIRFTMTEERSDYADVSFINLSDLAKGFVNSLNALIKIVFILAPWLAIGAVVALIIKAVRMKKSS